MLQFHCLHDNLDLAEVLVKLGTENKSKFKGNFCVKVRFLFWKGIKEGGFTKYVNEEYFPEMFQLGLDMLLRLGKIKEIVENLLSVGRVFLKPYLP